MSREFPVCIVRTEDNAIKHYAAHDPVQSQGESGMGPLRLNLNYDHHSASGQQVRQQVVLLVCRRCGVCYAGAQSVEYGKQPTGVMSPSGGSA